MKKANYTIKDALQVSKTTHTVTDRICTGKSNLKKKVLIEQHFEDVLMIKNLMSQFAFKHLLELETKDFKTHGYQYFFNITPASLRYEISSWEMQQLFHKVVCEHTLTHVNQVVKNRIFHLDRGEAKLIKGSLKWKNHRAYGNLATFLNSLRFYSVNSNADIPAKHKDKWDYYSQKFTEERLIQLLINHQENVNKRLHPVVYKTGSYIKAAQFNKNSKKPTWHSHWFKKNSCKKYKNWYLFKTPKWKIALPLQVNKKYHNKEYDLRKEHWVTLNQKGEVDISLVYDRTDVLLEPNKAVGLDLNVKTNLFATSNGILHKIEEDWLKKHEKKLEVLEKKGYQNLDIQDHLKLKKIVRHRESTLRNQIQVILKNLREQGVTDVVLESLTITLGGGLSRRMHKLLRLLRFGTIKTWMRQQAHKLGMRIHDFPPAFSSQACRCGHVDHSNRSGQEFKCSVCGEAEHADIHAGKSLLFLFEQVRDVLVQDGFLKVNNFGEYISTLKAQKYYQLMKGYYRKRESRIQDGILVIYKNRVLNGTNPRPLGRGS